MDSQGVSNTPQGVKVAKEKKKCGPLSLTDFVLDLRTQLRSLSGRRDDFSVEPVPSCHSRDKVKAGVLPTAPCKGLSSQIPRIPKSTEHTTPSAKRPSASKFEIRASPWPASVLFLTP